MKVLVVGGTGTVGRALIARYSPIHEVFALSRDESKQWQMKLEFPKVNFIIGDIRDKERTAEVLQRVGPDIVIIAAALKHVDICERNVHECISTNILGIKNVLDSIRSGTVCFISTDKACDPGNAYGMSKGLGEIMMIEKARQFPDIKFITVRFGNVLNSRGSIIPTLDFIGREPNRDRFELTDPDMNRYIMTAEQSLDLIEHAIANAESGDVVIPELVSMNIKDLFELFSEKYAKPIVVTGLRPGEKIREVLINETQARQVIKHGSYFHIRHGVFNSESPDCSGRLLSKDDLRQLLSSLNLY
jgi:UDP-N-acetylglucosamine 4,6-dehydratase/5-epimerase